MHGTLNSTMLTKTKNDVLYSIEQDRAYVKAHSQASEKFVDMMYDNKCKAVVDFYSLLMKRL